jgi:short-subunit dehydrogenase
MSTLLLVLVVAGLLMVGHNQILIARQVDYLVELHEEEEDDDVGAA